MSIRTIGKARYVVSLSCLPKKAIVQAIRGLDVQFTTKEKISSRVRNQLFINDETLTNKNVLRTNLFLADTKGDILLALNRLIKYVKENNL